jgi:acetaldehyde dehydrogenase/alcohol dehydrogenase
MSNRANPELSEVALAARDASAAPPGPMLDTLVDRASVAQRALEPWSERQIDRLLLALANVVADHAHPLAAATVAETGMGNVEDKACKNGLASVGVYQRLEGQIGNGEVRFDRERMVAEIASPMGVILGLVPATHPVATFIFKVLIAIKGRNAIILSPSHRATHVSEVVGGLIRDVLVERGASPDLVQWLGADSTRETTVSLMSHPRVAMVLATGGRAMVAAAYRSGTPAIGVGPGNAPVLIAADADVWHAAHSVVTSKAFDNGLICGAENHLVVESKIRARLIGELIGQGAAVLTDDEQSRFHDAVLDPSTKRLQKAVVGRDAATLAGLARIAREYPIKLLVVPTEGVDGANYLAAEKLAPVVSLFTVADADEGLTTCRALLEIEGGGHTAIIHARRVDLIQRFASTIRVGRVLVNSPATQGLMGLTTGLMPSLSLGCGTWGGNSTTNGITYTDLLNITRVAYQLADREPRAARRDR